MAIVGAVSPFKKKSSPAKGLFSGLISGIAGAFTAMNPIGQAALIAGGVMAYSGYKKKKRAKRQQRAAQAKLTQREKAWTDIKYTNPYAGLKNPYANLENVYEDLTVDTQGAEYMKQQTQQQQANIMQEMRGAAGASGAAGLAQSMANVGAGQAQRSAAIIAQQEAANRKMAVAESGRLQQLKTSGEFQVDMLQRRGEQFKKMQEENRVKAMYGASIDEKMAANQAMMLANQQMWSGISNMATSFIGGIGSGGFGGGGGVNPYGFRYTKTGGFGVGINPYG